MRIHVCNVYYTKEKKTPKKSVSTKVPKTEASEVPSFAKSGVKNPDPSSLLWVSERLGL